MGKDMVGSLDGRVGHLVVGGRRDCEWDSKWECYWEEAACLLAFKDEGWRDG